MQRRPSLTEGKLMIMRVLKSMEPLDENQFAEFFAEPDLLTFFEIKVALDELQGSELIAGRKRGNSQPDAYMLTAKGRTTYDMFMYDLPLPLRDKVDALLPEWRRRFRRREQVRTKYYRAGEDDYCAQLSIFEHGTPAMELTLHLPDSDQAQQAVQAFERNAERIYSDIWQSLSAKAEE